MTCPGCKRDFPADLLNTMVFNNARLLRCPLCALKLMNEATGLPADTPFRGPQAKALHERAVKLLKDTNQPL